ncbi:hypothetical protein HID58_050791 [Brassica napus]|uniref:Uncharacterized protein n=1 Tax=Brassica napus TaxID=3708 RepID=A0ABQ8A739_BRANA|nr:hypothetical protein HID58_050791 [Brassica napus]
MEVRLLSFWEIDVDSLITTKCLYEVKNRRTYISLSYIIDINDISYVEGENKYYGTKVTINVWEPKIQQQYEKYFNNIEAGWQYNDLCVLLQISRIYMVTN